MIPVWSNEMFRRVAATLALFLSASTAHASVTYSYVGRDFSWVHNVVPQIPQVTLAHNVTFSLTLDSALAPGATTQLCVHCATLPTGVLSWTLSSAGVSFNNINASSLNFVSMSLQTNSAGAVEGWFIEYLAPDVFPAYTLTTPPYVGLSGPTGADIYTSRGLLTGTSDGVAFGDSGCTDLCNQGTTNNPPGAASPGTWTVLPEPDTLTLLGVGLISLVGLAAPRRRKQ